jgi:uncharacterized protein
VIAVDTNLLVYAHREDSEWHAPALDVMVTLAESSQAWGLPWSVVHEFLAIVTHAKIFKPPTPLQSAFDAIEVWTSSPHCRLLGEGPDYLTRLRTLASKGRAAGPMIHDARVAAICLDNGVTELWTADRDFSRFRPLKCRNPLVD